MIIIIIQYLYSAMKSEYTEALGQGLAPMPWAKAKAKAMAKRFNLKTNVKPKA